MDEQLGRREELELMFKKYSYVPREMIIQEDTNRLGFAFTEPALKALQPFANKPYGIFVYDRVDEKDQSRDEFTRVPYELFLTGGIYGLRGHTTVVVHTNPSSPYIVDVIDGKVALCEREGDKNRLISWIGKPYPISSLLSMTFEDGTRYGEVTWTASCHEDIRFCVFRLCQYWAHGLQCKFCDIGSSAKKQQQLGLRSRRPWFEKVEHVAKIAEEVFLHTPLDWPVEKRPRGILVTGGQILTEVNGQSEDDFYLSYIRGIREKIGNRWPIHLATAPKTKEVAKRYVDAGVTSHETNIEIWDEEIFNNVCPGKAKYYGHDKWLKLMIDEVDVFGEGNVSPCLVSGVEMCQPWGFKTVDEAIKSNIEGFEYLMSHGVVPRPYEWAIVTGSSLRDNVPAPLEFYVRYNIAWFESWTKYRLPLPRRYNLAGKWREECNRGWQRIAWEGMQEEIPVLEAE